MWCSSGTKAEQISSKKIVNYGSRNDHLVEDWSQAQKYGRLRLPGQEDAQSSLDQGVTDRSVRAETLSVNEAP
jgi:hypothetical protein